MSVAAHHLLLVTAVTALGLAGLHLAGACGARGVIRVIGALCVATASAVAIALLLGLFALADEPLLLTGAAVAVFVLARKVVSQAPPAADELALWWSGLGRRDRFTAGALAGLSFGWMAWQLRHPYVGVDGFTYHLPLAAEWAQTGRPGSLVDLIAGVPVANYPVTNEVAVGYLTGISRSWVAASTWTYLLMTLWLAGIWAVLRDLGLSRHLRWAAVAACATLPLAVSQLGGPYTDLPATAWVVAVAALASASVREPRILALAIVGAGLCYGTKTTAALLAVAALGGALVARPAVLRAHARLFTAATLLGIGVGIAWSLRNVLDHGSPLWPFIQFPGGDPIPPAFEAYDRSFISHPLEMLDGRVGSYIDALSGGFILLVGALTIPFVVRSGVAIRIALVTAAALLVWAVAPFTGIDENTPLAVGATRYLLPALGAAAAAVAVAGLNAPRLAAGVLWFAAAVSLAKSLSFGFPAVPATGTLVFCAAVGGGIAVLARVRVPRPALAAGAGLVAVAVLTAGATDYLGRHAEAGLPDAGIVRAALERPEFADGDFPIAMGPATVGLLRGDRLQHRMPFLGDSEPCRRVRARLGEGWVVLQHKPETVSYRRLAGCLQDRRPAFRDETYELYVR